MRRKRGARNVIKTVAWTLACLLVVCFLILLSGHQRVLLLGVDRRPNDPGRSDTMMVIEPQWHRGRVALLSIPRDTRVDHPGLGVVKINALYPRQGPEAAKAAVEVLLGVPITGYVLIDLAAAEALIDAFGGLTIDVEERMYYHDPYQDLLIDLMPGRQHLDGEAALGFVRYRGGPHADIGRVARQREFIRALLAEAAKPANWLRLPAAVQAWLRHVETDLTTWQALSFLAATAFTSRFAIEGETVPGRAASIDGGSYWLADDDATARVVAELFR